MAERPPTRVYDGFLELSRGVHSGRAKTLLSNSHVAFATNATFRGDQPRNRPGWKKVDVDLSGCEGKFQGATVFEGYSGRSSIIASIGGEIYEIDVQAATETVTDITVVADPTTDPVTYDPNNGNQETAWFCQTPGYLVIQDGESRPLIFDGTSLRRSSITASEVPVGTAMAYVNGRLWVALTDGRQFVASDLIYDPSSGSAEVGFRNSVLRFTENAVLAGGGAFGVATSQGKITALTTIGVTDTTTGTGPLLVCTERSISAVNLPYLRDQWATIDYPAQTVLLPSGGPSGPRCLTNVNGDVWYRDRLGVRSLRAAVADFSHWVNQPLSRPMSRIMRRDDRLLLRFGSAVEFDNRLLMTVTPQRAHGYGVYHLGLAVLDFDQIADGDDLGLGKSAPVWEGMWTGLKILQIVKGTFDQDERCFIFALNDSDEYELWELTRNDPWDSEDNPITWTLELPSYVFGFPNERKELKGGKVWLKEMSGDVTMVVEFSPDGYPLFQSWGEVDLCATTERCGSDACEGSTYLPQPRNPIHFTEPSGSCKTGDVGPTNPAYAFSPKITISGAVTIDRLRLEAVPVADDRGRPCSEDEGCTSISGCEDDPYEYETTL